MKTPEFEFYHGMVLRRLLVDSQRPLTIVPFDFSGRVDSFKINECVVVYMKHSTARLPPWPFTFNNDALREIIELRRRVEHVFIVLICGDEGMVALSLQDFISISETRPGGAVPIRVTRNRNEMFAVSGNLGELERRKSSGLGPVLKVLQVEK